MKSPFPGMDPYLEQHWSDVHHSFVTYARNALQLCLPDDLRARTEERVYVEREDEPARRIVPDISVIERPEHWSAGSRDRSGGIATAEPIAVVQQDPVREGFIEIRVKGGGKLVTVIEFISPANKIPGTGRVIYQRKQEELQAADVNLVEIDLVRTGPRVFDFPKPVPSRHSSDLMACVRRGVEFSLYAFALREPLPALRIPLRWEDEPVALDLQSLHDQCYHDGAYDDIDYTLEPQPPFAPDDAAWADSLLRGAGNR